MNNAPSPELTVLYEDDRVRIARLAGQGYLQIDKTFTGTGRVIPGPDQNPMNQIILDTDQPQVCSDCHKLISPKEPKIVLGRALQSGQKLYLSHSKCFRYPKVQWSHPHG